MNAHASAVRGARPGITGLAPGGSGETGGAGTGARAAAQLLLLLLRTLSTPLGRRLLVVVVVTLMLGSLVSSLYDHADGAGAGTARAVAVATGPAGAAPTADLHRANSESVARQVGSRPEDAAADWFAKQRHLARGKVQALQQQRISGTERRVLVVADAGGGKLPTAYVTVKLGSSGWA